MSDILLVAIIVLLVLNGGLLGRARVWLLTQWPRWRKEFKRRVKNYRAQRGQK